MKILRMEATFGKLEGAVLTLQPGLNILEGENEWGKSTWCAFLMAMLYGLDTRAKTTKTTLAEKERYAPWSGSPMAGRMDILWQGKNITIERATKGRIPMGVFRAYETHSGLEVPELTAANCGQLLLGAEQSVFRRAGFLRLADLPVSEDDALRRRLNALVTTGDESGEAERLEKGLRELKNRCRYHRNGLLPQAEAELARVNETLEELTGLEGRCMDLRRQLTEEESRQALLENHRAALDYAAAREDAARVRTAGEEAYNARAALLRLESLCADLPPREETREQLTRLNALREQLDRLNGCREEPLQPQTVQGLPPFLGMPPELAEIRVGTDTFTYRKAKRAGFWLPAALMLLAAAGVAFWQGWVYPGAGAAAAALAAAVTALVKGSRNRNIIGELAAFYGAPTPEEWNLLLERHIRRCREESRARQSELAAQAERERQVEQLQTRLFALCGGDTPEKTAAAWQQSLQRWDRLDQARQRYDQTRSHYESLRAMAKPAPPPAEADGLTHSREETESLLRQTLAEQQRLNALLGQYRGRMGALGDASLLQSRKQNLIDRIRSLEAVCQAASLGLQTLEEARQTLQRRFAPRITGRAQELLERLTAGRYRQLRLTRDLGLHARAGEETVLREALWRSDGTVDQLYLALRLAVAEELTPDAPLVLDDALVRFDDKRLRAALEVLEELSQTKQILLFTCQSRENTVLNGKL